MADVDTSEQKHKGKEEQNKAGTERHLQDDGQRLDEAIRDNVIIEKNCKTTLGSIATANRSLVNIDRSVNDVDIVKKKVTVVQDDLNRQIEEIEAQADIQLWKSKFEVAACEKIEVLRFLEVVEGEGRAPRPGVGGRQVRGRHGGLHRPAQHRAQVWSQPFK